MFKNYKEFILKLKYLKSILLFCSSFKSFLILFYFNVYHLHEKSHKNLVEVGKTIK